MTGHSEICESETILFHRLLVRQMETAVSSMKVAVHCMSLRLAYSLWAMGLWSGQIHFLSSLQRGHDCSRWGRAGGGVCACICVNERERETEKERENKGKGGGVCLEWM